MATSTRPPTTDRPDQLASLNGGGPASRDRTWHEWMMLGVGLTAVLAIVAIVSAVIALSSKTATTTTIIRQGAAGSSAATHRSATGGMGNMAGNPSTTVGAGMGQAGAGAVVPMVLQLDAPKGVPGTVTGQDGWPRYAPSNITVPAGKKVTLMITNYDDVATPLNAGVPYNRVMGGQETVAGKPVSYVGNKTIAHTLTVTGLGVNVPIPVAPHGGSVTTTFTFIVHKAGTYTFQCYTPCGLGKDGMSGPMIKQGYMQGTLTVA